MSYDLDDIIEHYGVKGMKWGVRKVGKTVGKMNARRAEKQDAYHDKKMKSSKTYKAIYESTPNYRSVKGRDRIRQKAARVKYRGIKRDLAMIAVGVTGAALSTPKGAKVTSAMSDFVISGDAQRLGKNVLNTILNNPVKVVDGSKMANVVLSR